MDHILNVVYESKARDRLVPYEKTVTITENRAPTDESIKIYDQMLEQARANLVDVFTIKNAIFTEARVAVYRNVASLFCPLEAYYKFKLNDTVFEGKIQIEDSRPYTAEDFRRLLSDEVYNRFIEELSRKLFETYCKTLMVEGKHSNYNW